MKFFSRGGRTVRPTNGINQPLHLRTKSLQICTPLSGFNLTQIKPFALHFLMFEWHT
ncbi:MAG: hypothetical protein OET44_16140 [Gammaproteobacteria bacterium]|nr:hypothetical protein [Gammaproteobacteria bacterium]